MYDLCGTERLEDKKMRVEAGPSEQCDRDKEVWTCYVLLERIARP